MNTLFGMQVHTSAALPRFEQTLKVRSDVPMTPEGRAAMDAWLKERFGMREVFFVFNNPGMGPALLMHPESLRKVVKVLG